MDETRYTDEVLWEAAKRVNATKARLVDEAPTAHEAGKAVLAEFGYDDTVFALAMSEVDNIEKVFDVGELPEQVKRMILTTYLDALMVGAIATDITWERNFGLTEVN